MKRFLLLLTALLVGFVSTAQVTNYEEKWYGSDKETRGRIVSIEVAHDYVIVTFELKALKSLKRMNIFQSSATAIYSNGEHYAGLSGLLQDGKIYDISDYHNQRGWDHVGAGETRRYKLLFKGHIPSTVKTISIKDTGVYDTYAYNVKRSGWSWSNWGINVSRRNYLYGTESEIRRNIDQNNDGICGIYTPFGQDKSQEVTLACVKSNGEYYLVYVSSSQGYWDKHKWEVGDIKAKLQRTPSGIFMTDSWRGDNNGSDLSTAYFTFDGVSMVYTSSSGKTNITYLKTYPYSSSSSSPSTGGSTSQSREWTGTGFALNNGYVVTNHHVVEGATSISVVGVNGRNTELKAQVISVDKKNDLALIRITDSRFTGFGTIPYSVKTALTPVGSDVFVLGYPMTYYMGEEIKLTNGIISSNSGYKGDITTYQISAPVQPGNSGGPLFDKDGNIIGIVNAKISDAENVGYAIKTTYLNSLVSSSVSGSVMPSYNSVAGKSLPEKVKVLRNYVFFIKCR